MIKKLLLILFLPVIGFSQTNLTSLLFELIDSKDYRTTLESEGWQTNSINSQIDKYGVRYNELYFSKHNNPAQEENYYSSYFTIKEYPQSNIVELKLYDKIFYNKFQETIVKSGYKKVFHNVSNNTLKNTYEKDPIEINLKEKLNNYFLITLMKYEKHQPTSQYFTTNAFIAADKVNVRNNPSVNSAITGQLDNREKVMVVDEVKIFVNQQFVLDKNTLFYTNTGDYMLNSGKMISQINTAVPYNGRFITTDSIWLTASVIMDETEMIGVIQKKDISAANTQKWYKIVSAEFSGWVYGDFVRALTPPPPPPPTEFVIDEDKKKIEEEEEITDEIYMVVEDMPLFKGCLDESCSTLEIMKFISENTLYPQIAKENNITGRVFVSFIVDKTGTVTNVKILRGVDKHLDAEAVRVVSILPKFKPGKQRGKPVKVQYNVPINFRLN